MLGCCSLLRCEGETHVSESAVGMEVLNNEPLFSGVPAMDFNLTLAVGQPALFSTLYRPSF